MAIYPEKKDGKHTGRWRVEVQVESLRKRGRFNSHAEALKAEQKFRQELEKGTTEGQSEIAGAKRREDNRAAPKTLSQLVRKAAPLLWDGSAHGALSEGKVITVVTLCGDPALDRLNSSYIDDAITALREEGKSPATVNRYLSALHSIVAWGHKRGYITKLPEFGWQDEDEGRIRYLSTAEEDKLIRTLRSLGFDAASDFVSAAIDTGCRRSELLGAAVDQLEGDWLRLWKTKNGHARSVPLTDRAREILQSRLPWNITAAQLRYAWDKAKVAMGLEDDKDFVLHACRHTCATRLVERNVNLRVIQQFMGHRAIQTTLRYAHVSDGMLAEAAGRLSGGQPVTAGGNPHDTGGGGAKLGDQAVPHPAAECAPSTHPQRSLIVASE